MSRSVSAPSSVTNTSPCWNGFIVPGSTLRYGSSFCMVTRRPRARRRCPRLLAVSPLPSEEATPPVTKMCLVCCATGLQSMSRAVGARHIGPDGVASPVAATRALPGRPDGAPQLPGGAAVGDDENAPGHGGSQDRERHGDPGVRPRPLDEPRAADEDPRSG